MKIHSKISKFELNSKKMSIGWPRKTLVALISNAFILNVAVGSELIGSEAGDLLYYDGSNKQWINSLTGQEVPTKVIDGLRTLEVTVNQDIKGYDGNIGSWNEVSELPFDKAVFDVEGDVYLTDGHRLTVQDTDAIFELRLAEGKNLYGEFDPSNYYSENEGLISPDNSAGLIIVGGFYK